jgi:site-specific DNA recombinase
MPNTNGHGPKRAILYARVSTDEQARSGYSLAQQLEALRDYAARESYEVLEEVSDPGQSGASLERPGMDRVRDLVAGGGVSVVLAQDRDRFAREPAYHYLLRREFEEYGTKIRALNDRGDDTPEGDLTDGILDQLAKYERAKIAERSRRGKLRKVREGLLIKSGQPHFGFRYNATDDQYEVEPGTMALVRRVFEMVAEGSTLYTVTRTLEREGVEAPAGGTCWRQKTLRDIILDTVYEPHPYAEIAELVTSAVAARLDQIEDYGVLWWGKRKTTERQVRENGGYKKKQITVTKPRSEWVAIPVPGSGIPRELVRAAREAIKDNRPTFKKHDKLYELSGGILRCGCCESRMTASPNQYHHYYRCARQKREGKSACPESVNLRAEIIEAEVWEFVSGLLLNPEELRTDLDTAIEIQRGRTPGNPDEQARLWANKLVEVDRKRARYHEMAAGELITFDELRTKLAEFDEVRNTATRELEALRGHKERVAQLEQDRDALLDFLEEIAPEALANRTPEERHQVYKILQLKVTISPDSPAEVNGVFDTTASSSAPMCTENSRRGPGRGRCSRCPVAPG